MGCGVSQAAAAKRPLEAPAAAGTGGSGGTAPKGPKTPRLHTHDAPAADGPPAADAPQQEAAAGGLALAADVKASAVRAPTVTAATPGDSNASFAPGALAAKQEGAPGTLEYRLRFSYDGVAVSPWHDVPLFTDAEGEMHFMCEIPKWTRAKYEVATQEDLNPIKQDAKKGVLREYKWGDMLFNYGFFPQTWEDPNHVDPDTSAHGDDDPLDVVEVGARQMKSGEVARVKVLGVLGMIDDGETDWKVFVIRCDDPLAGALNDIDDLDRELPGCVNALREWLRVYKVPEGKPINNFALDERAMPREYALKVIHQTHESWSKNYGELAKNIHGSRGTGQGILRTPSMHELKLRSVENLSEMANQ